MNAFELFCLIYYALDAIWEKNNNDELRDYLSDANPFLFKDIGSADPAVYKEFHATVPNRISLEDSYGLALKYLRTLNSACIYEAFQRIEEEKWKEGAMEYLSSPHKGADAAENLSSEANVSPADESASETTAEKDSPPPESAAPADEVSTRMERRLNALQASVDALRKMFEDKIAEDAHKNALFDNMHRELTRYQNGVADKILETMALDVIQLTDDVQKKCRIFEKKEPTEENYTRLLRALKGIAEDLQDILYRQSIEAYRVAGHEVDVRRQKILQTVETDIPERDNLVAARMADGYEKDGKVIRPERIKIFKYAGKKPET